MLDVGAESLFHEYKAAHSWTKKHLKAYEGQRRGYHGKAYQAFDPQGEAPILENHYFDWTSFAVGRLVHANPVFSMGTRRQGEKQKVDATRIALNQIVQDQNWRKFLAEGPVLDAQFAWGLTITRQEPDPSQRPTEHTIQGRIPKIYRISPERSFMDSLAVDRSSQRLQGHVYSRDREDLLKESKDKSSGWNAKVLADLAPDSMGEGGNFADRYMARNRNASDITRNEVFLAEMYVPEHQIEGFKPEDGYHGTIFTVAVDGAEGKDGFVKDPVPFYGPPSGPYTWFGAYTVPDDPHYLSPLLVVEEQIRDLNRHAWAISRSGQKYKKLIFVDATDPQAAQKAQWSDHMEVIPWRGLKGVEQVEMGGATSTQYEYLYHRRANLDRVAAFNESQRGVPSGSTATAVSEAAASTDTRFGFLEQQIEDAVEEQARKVAWYLYNDNRVSIPLGPEAAKELGAKPEVFLMKDGSIQELEPALTYQGGVDENDVAFEDLQISLEADSMKRTDANLAQARTMQGLELVLNYAPLMPQITWVDWRGLFEDAANALNMPQLKNRLLWEELAEISKNPKLSLSPEAQNPQLAPPGAAQRPAQQPQFQRPKQGNVTGAMLGTAQKSPMGTP